MRSRWISFFGTIFFLPFSILNDDFVKTGSGQNITKSDHRELLFALARAFANARGELYVAVVNERLAPVANISVSVTLADGVTSALAPGTNLIVSFEESRTLTATAGGLITEPLGSYGARVYRVESGSASTSLGRGGGGGSSSVADGGGGNNLVTNAEFSAQTLVGTPDHWLLFPTIGTPAGSMDLDAVLMADPAAARRGSNTTAALCVVLSNPLGTGIHLPLSVDHTGLSSAKSYSLSVWTCPLSRHFGCQKQSFAKTGSDKCKEKLSKEGVFCSCGRGSTR